jgi:hypothetical protein
MSGVTDRPNARDLSAATREFPSAEVCQHSNTTAHDAEQVLPSNGERIHAAAVR